MARGLVLSTEPRSRSFEAEELLMLAVLEQAVADLDHSSPAVRADADGYIFSYGNDYSIFSFDSVCSYFKLSPTAVREALRARGSHPRKTTAELFKSAA
jgi:hypothetical protein